MLGYKNSRGIIVKTNEGYRTGCFFCHPIFLGAFKRQPVSLEINVFLLKSMYLYYRWQKPFFRLLRQLMVILDLRAYANLNGLLSPPLIHPKMLLLGMAMSKHVLLKQVLLQVYFLSLIEMSGRTVFSQSSHLVKSWRVIQ